MNHNRSKNIACALIIFIVLMITLPVVLSVRLKKFNDMIDEKTKTIQTLQSENDILKDEVKTLNKQVEDDKAKVLKLNQDYSNLMKDYKELKKQLDVPEEEEKVTVEKVKDNELHAQKPEVPTTTQKKEEVTTEKVKEKPTTEEPKKEASTEKSVKKKEKSTEKKDDSGLRYSAEYPKSSGHLTRSNGSIRYNGHRETWYSTNESAGQATAVSIPGKHVADDGTIRDKDGYICVASSDHRFYTVIQTSVGPGKVYDCGCSHGTIDVYTNW